MDEAESISGNTSVALAGQGFTRALGSWRHKSQSNLPLSKPGMAELEQPRDKANDLRSIYKDDPIHLDDALTGFWPTLAYWEHIKDGQKVQIRLHNLTAVIMFLRRMYAFWGGKDLSGGEPTPLTTLAWKKDPFPKDATPKETQEINDLLKELGFFASGGQTPTFEDILHHKMLGQFWGTASMTLTCDKPLQKGEDGAWSVSDRKFEFILRDLWKVDIVRIKSQTPVHEAVRRVSNRLIPAMPKKGLLERKVLCNFPPFIRVAYRFNSDDPNPSQRFSDLRSFQLRAETLINGSDTMKKEHAYVLIACFLKPNPNNENDIGEIRLYFDDGHPIQPLTPLPEIEHLYNPDPRRIGDPGVDCILLYAKATRLIDDMFSSELACGVNIPNGIIYMSKNLHKLRAFSALERVQPEERGDASTAQKSKASDAQRKPAASTAQKAGELDAQKAKVSEGQKPAASNANKGKRPYTSNDDTPPSKRRAPNDLQRGNILVKEEPPSVPGIESRLLPLRPSRSPVHRPYPSRSPGSPGNIPPARGGPLPRQEDLFKSYMSARYRRDGSPNGERSARYRNGVFKGHRSGKHR
ncbi:hypothetical protein O1611_g444 [Lasiodiplodia mahajangana]|uniref:Uncharacterized protein n=1 Tax=Lasiodiplodia mahajangana TaxID=1108764 RepID=A0ACC2K0I5_9PEZI|nr:hypothetical protein O1611_g444 [Lasiodiplodia mahajangana]